MNKLEVGMLVRTKTGYICKIINVNDYREPSLKYGVEASYLKDVMFIGDYDIKNATHNIIDLIEVGDYVNGYKVSDIKKDIIYCCEDEFEDYCIKIDKKDIKSIVTKEQFESMEYDVSNE